jgi:Arc/MetJ-type ribon-helix-helix transcriptional regulator
MPTIFYKVTLTRNERDELEALIKSGKRAASAVRNALILLGTDAGDHQAHRQTNQQLCEALLVDMRTIDRVKHRFVEQGMDAALHRKSAAERPNTRRFDGDAEARLIALSCSQPPKGRCRWTLRLLADKLVELEVCKAVSHETVRQALKKTNSSPGKNTTG